MIPFAIIFAVLLTVYLLLFLDCRRLTVTFTQCRHANVTKPFRTVQVSDLHDCRFGKDQQTLIQAISDAKPDYIVITGDLFNRMNRKACKNAFLFVKRAVKIAPVYYIEGNHEASLQETGERYIAEVGRLGAHILRDAYTDLSECRLIGLKQRAPAEMLRSMLKSDRLNLVLAHRPEQFPEYAETNADVILTGHAHGGQIRLFHRGIYASNQGFFPKFTDGWYEIGNSRMYVSRGLGNTVPVPRVFNTPELNVIDFLPDTDKGE